MHGSNHEKQKISLCLGSMQYIFRGIIQYIKPINYTSHILMTAVGSCIACIKILGHFTSLDMLLINEKKVVIGTGSQPASFALERQRDMHDARTCAAPGPDLDPRSCLRVRMHVFDTHLTRFPPSCHSVNDYSYSPTY